MNSRMILDTYSMDKDEAVNLICFIMEDLPLEDLEHLLFNVLEELEKREQAKDIDLEGDEDDESE